MGYWYNGVLVHANSVGIGMRVSWGVAPNPVHQNELLLSIHVLLLIFFWKTAFLAFILH